MIINKYTNNVFDQTMVGLAIRGANTFITGGEVQIQRLVLM